MLCIRPIYRFRYPLKHTQQGAAFIVMLVIMIIGVTTLLVGALSNAGLQTARNEKSGDMLALSKEILVGYAVNGTGGGQRPGDLPYPDRLIEATPNYDGNTDSCPTLQAAPTSTGCLGRLPWSTPLFLSMTSPSENDPTGLMPWYAVSANMVDPAGVTMNSELLNTAPHTWLTVRDMNGNVLSNRVAFVVIIPGSPINGQSRPASPNLGGANQYLDSISFPVGCGPTPPAPACTVTYSNADADDSFIMGDEHRWIDDPSNPGHQIEDASYNFNDKLIYVTIDDLMPLIEKRIAREVKNCLDTYATSSGDKYPWAAPIASGGYTTTSGTLFGRIPSAPTINTPYSSSDPWINDMLNYLTALQTALDAYAANNTWATRNALDNAGYNLRNIADDIIDATSPAYPANIVAVATPAKSAGGHAQHLANGDSGYTISGVQSRIDSANTALAALATAEDPDMQISWPTGCFASGTYWDDWKSLVLYQLADGYKPLTTTPGCGSSCLSVNGSGNPNSGSGTYRAAITMAGKKLPGQTRVTQTVDQYLELNNQTAQTGRSYGTYKPTDADYSTVNDLVLCIDGKNNCK